MLQLVDSIAWAAGFFDGEGCVSITKKKGKNNNYYSMKLDVYQVDRTPLDIFVLLFGGNIHRRPRTKSWNFTGSRDGWVWCQCSTAAAGTLTKMLPYLVVKRAQAEIAIEFQRKKARKGPTSYLDAASLQKEQDQYEEVRRLKVIQ